MIKKPVKKQLSSTFEEAYWEQNYSDPDSMDCIGNAKEHALYLKALFEIENIKIRSLVDLGFGYGALFKEMIKTFQPKRALGLEPSQYAFHRFKLGKLKNKTSIQLKNQGLLSFLEKSTKTSPYDLGICTSVFQYPDNQTLKKIIPLLSQKVKYLYFTVPTDMELEIQVKEFNFEDPYAIHRSQKEYHELLSPYFTFVGLRLLESRHFFSEKNTKLSDLMFRF